MHLMLAIQSSSRSHTLSPPILLKTTILKASIPSYFVGELSAWQSGGVGGCKKGLAILFAMFWKVA